MAVLMLLGHLSVTAILNGCLGSRERCPESHTSHLVSNNEIFNLKFL